MSWQDKVAKEFNRSFNEPFMPDGFCKAEVITNSKGKRYLQIQLGDRDVEFDEKGNSTGSGSKVGDAIQWETKKLETPYPPVFDEGES